ncbi:MAG: SulP family inorganic anion transporter [Anaerolineae bacterium]|nr:SulP family inorganic anion transporter [Anaerolineae bacterium]
MQITFENTFKRILPDRKSLTSDALAGLTGAVAGAPQAMGFALIAGVNPIYGLYAAFISTIVGSLTSGSTFMTIAPTNALSLVVFSTLGDNGTVSIEKMIVLTLLVGVFQLGFGLLRLGDLTRFVSNAVMTGFITGAGLLIVLGQLKHVNGFDPQTASFWPLQLAKWLPNFFDWLLHLPQSEPHTFILGVAAIIIIATLHHTRFKNIATLLAILVTTLFVMLMGWSDVETVASVPAGLPVPSLPQMQYAVELAPAALAMAVLALVQSAALTQTVREPDGSIPNANRDFVAQGLSNIVGGFFQGMPSGGSLSRTAVNVSAGAKTRWANIFSGLYIGLILLAFGGLIEKITLAALAGHLVVAAFSLIRPREIALVWRVNPSARAAMVATFVSTLILPLEFSIYIGVFLSLGLYIYSSSGNVKVVQLVRAENNHFREIDLPKTLPEHGVTIISVHGHLYFAAVHHLEGCLPDPTIAHHTVVILRLRNNRYMGSTGIHLLERYAKQLRHHGGRLILSGVSPFVRDQLSRTQSLQFFGEDNIFVQSDTIFGATEHALEAAETWLKTTS